MAKSRGRSELWLGLKKYWLKRSDFFSPYNACNLNLVTKARREVSVSVIV